MAAITQQQIALLAFAMRALNLYPRNPAPSNYDLAQVRADQDTFKKLYLTTVSNAFGISNPQEWFENKIHTNSEELMTGRSQFLGFASIYGSEEHIRQHLITCYPGIEICPKIQNLNQNGTKQNYANNSLLIMGIMLSLTGIGIAIAAIAVCLSVAATVVVPIATSAIGVIGIFGGAALIANGLDNRDVSLNTTCLR